MSNNISALGFNGKYLDDTLDNYHLGNGYRAYNPTIMQFTAPDDMSPFGKGGVNPYVYVSCDPINNTDPTGHFLGIAAMLLMVLPVTFPKELTFKGMIEAAGESIENSIFDEGVNTITEIFTAGAATAAIPAIDVAIAPVKHLAEQEMKEVAQHSIADYLTSQAVSSRVTARAPDEHEALLRAIKSKEEDDFTHLISHRHPRIPKSFSNPAVKRVRKVALNARAKGRMYIRDNTRFFAFRLDDGGGMYSTRKELNNELGSSTNLQKYTPDDDVLDYFKDNTNDRIFDDSFAKRVDGSFKQRQNYKDYLFYKLIQLDD